MWLLCCDKNAKATRLLVLAASLSLLALSCESRTSHTVETDSKIFSMNRAYKSMFGPNHNDLLTLLDTDEPEILWVTAIQADVVGADGETPESSEYFCHSVLTRAESQPANRKRLLGRRLGRARKMFTLVQGLTEIRFPDGFGMPVLSNDKFTSHVMVMNPSEPDEPVRVGVDSRIEYIRESELAEEMKPLFLLPLITKVPVEGEDVDHGSHEHGGDQTCLATDADLLGARSVDRTGHTPRSPITQSGSGQPETGHWYVPPGRHVYRHRLDPLDQRINFDTRAHYIYAHLHPYGESLELIDLTTGESVFKATAHNYPDRVAVEEITHYSSQEGLAINRHHDHEIVAVYNNTTTEDVDSMAVMYLYLRDQPAAQSPSRHGETRKATRDGSLDDASVSSPATEPARSSSG